MKPKHIFLIIKLIYNALYITALFISIQFMPVWIAFAVFALTCLGSIVSSVYIDLEKKFNPKHYE